MRTIAKISEAWNQTHQIEVAIEKCEFYLSKLDDQARRAAENRAAAQSTMNNWDARVHDARRGTASCARSARTPR